MEGIDPLGLSLEEAYEGRNDSDVSESHLDKLSIHG
jgi:hypothetical protein